LIPPKTTHFVGWVVGWRNRSKHSQPLLLTRPYLCNGAPLIGASGPSLARRVVERRTDPDLETLGQGSDGETKTDASDGYVPMHPVLASRLRAWQRETQCERQDFVFPSMKEAGREAARRFYVACRPPAPSREKGWGADRGLSKVWTS
jgi:hypothetical protein